MNLENESSRYETDLVTRKQRGMTCGVYLVTTMQKIWCASDITIPNRAYLILGLLLCNTALTSMVSGWFNFAYYPHP